MDLRNVEYAILDRSDVVAKALLHRITIGYAHCARDGERLALGDIKILDEMPLVGRWPVRLIRSLVWTRRKRRLRHRGIGSELLRRVLMVADSTGIQEVWGSVMQKDIDDQPTLLRWYKRLGFALQTPDSECVPGAAWKIVRRG